MKRNMTRLYPLRPGLAVLLTGALLAPAASAADSIPFSAGQVADGQEIYQEHCQICHGTTLSNGQFGTPLRGAYFQNKWGGVPLGVLVRFSYESMPPDQVMLLAPRQYAEVTAFILDANGLAPGGQAMPGDFQALNAFTLPW